MIADLKPYPDYRDSGLQWIGRVPEHWEVRRLKNWVAINEVTLPENSPASFRFEYVDIGAVGTGRKSRAFERMVFAAAPSRARRVVRSGDTIVSTVRTYLKAVLTLDSVTEPLIASTGFAVLSPRSDTLPNCLGYVFQSEHFTDQLVAESVGVAYPAIAESRLANIPVLLPPPPEQAAIVRFLTWANGRLERAIRAKRKVIALLNEQKQAIIHRTVTRGLDPSVPLKPSGIPWLGEIPAHWEVRRLRTLVRSIEQGVSPQAVGFLAEGDTWGVLKSGCVNHGVFRQTEHKQLERDFPIDPGIVVRLGDVLISRACGSPSLVGSVGRVKELNYRLILSDKTFRPRFNGLASIDFMVFAMNSRYYREQVEQAISGAEGMANNLPLSSLRDFLFALPPRAEAMAIAQALEDEVSRSLESISRLSREIDLLHEYRTRLVSDVVTGKLDVRGVAAGLPEEVLEEEAAEPLELEAENEEAVG